jgi:protein-L-isoaspartate(D-aspartate) O-methyltransferase
VSLLSLAAVLIFSTVSASNVGADTGETRYRERRRQMVENQIERRSVSDTKVLEAMRTVPRHLFVPEKHRNRAYHDRPLPIGFGQTISQPYIVAYMTEVLQIESGDKVLEVGTGSGYQAAVLAEITRKVYSIEIIDELAGSAEEHLEEASYGYVRTKNGDGYYGWEEHAPFDAIIVTAAAGHIPPPLISQLEEGGRMIIPVGGVYEPQSLMLVQKSADGDVRTERLLTVRFVPMTGAVQEGD